MDIVASDAPAPAGAASEPWRSALVLALLVMLFAIVGPRHEAWFDEAQAWLIGRDTTLWDLLIHRLPYEGTPALWHGLLWFAAHAGLPYAHLWMVSAALACAGAWVILTRAPFPYWLRVGIVFSYFMAYQYAIIARNYALDVLLIPLVAASFADRLQRPVRYGVLLGLTASVNAHSFLIAGILSAEFLLAILRAPSEKSRDWQGWHWRPWRWPPAQLCGAAIALVLAGIAALQGWPPSDSSYLSTLEPALGRGVRTVFEAFIDRLDIWSGLPPTEMSESLGFALTALLLAPSAVLFQRARVALLVTAVFAVLLGFAIVAFSHVWHAGLLYLSWIFALWISWKALAEFGETRRRITVASIAIIVFVNVYYTAAASLRDIREPYSAAPAAARLLATEHAPIAAVGFKTFAVQPWFARNVFLNYHDGAPGAIYYAWRLGEDFLPYVALGLWREAANNTRYNTLLLSTHNLKPEHMPLFFAVSERAGYCAPTTFTGGLIWKSYVMESDDLLVFRRCAGGLAGLHTAPRR